MINYNKISILLNVMSIYFLHLYSNLISYHNITNYFSGRKGEGGEEVVDRNRGALLT